MKNSTALTSKRPTARPRTQPRRAGRAAGAARRTSRQLIIAARARTEMPKWHATTSAAATCASSRRRSPRPSDILERVGGGFFARWQKGVRRSELALPDLVPCHRIDAQKWSQTSDVRLRRLTAGEKSPTRVWDLVCAVRNARDATSTSHQRRIINVPLFLDTYAYLLTYTYPTPFVVNDVVAPPHQPSLVFNKQVYVTPSAARARSSPRAARRTAAASPRTAPRSPSARRTRASSPSPRRRTRGPARPAPNADPRSRGAGARRAFRYPNRRLVIARARRVRARRLQRALARRQRVACLRRRSAASLPPPAPARGPTPRRRHRSSRATWPPACARGRPAAQGGGLLLGAAQLGELRLQRRHRLLQSLAVFAASATRGGGRRARETKLALLLLHHLLERVHDILQLLRAARRGVAARNGTLLCSAAEQLVQSPLQAVGARRLLVRLEL